MRTSNRIVQCRQSRLILSVSALACIIGATVAAAETSELDSFEAAVISQNKQAALAFIDEFSSSHLVGDLIELLRPEVAHEVCADLPSGATSAQDACQKLEVRLATPQTAGKEPQAIPSRDSAAEPEPLQSTAQDSAADLGISDAAISPGAGTSESIRALASTRSRSRGTTGERSGEKTVVPLMPRLAVSSPESDDDTHAKKPASREEPEKAPKSKSQQSAPSDPFPGSDPGSEDTGGANSASSKGKDPGSDPGSDSGGDADRDSHN